MGGVGLAACTLLLLCPLALTRHDDDFAFDNSEEFQVELSANHSEITKRGLKRLWGVPDTVAYVGHLFRMEIPKEAFSGEVVAYKVRSDDGRRTPTWLAVDSKHGLVSGVPLPQDLGPHSFTVTAHGYTATASDSFIVEVKKSSEKPQRYGACGPKESRLLVSILVDAEFQRITPRQRTRALMDLAHFMNLEGGEFSMEPYKPALAQSVLMSGAGTARQRKYAAAATSIYLDVGCGEKLWTRHKVLVAGLREQARDGTLTHILQLPVLGWRLLAVKPAPRTKRQSAHALAGSGDYNYDDGDADGDEMSGDYDDDEDDYAAPDPERDHLAATTPAPHPHRHHHGDDIPEQTPPPPPPLTPSPTTTLPPTTTTLPPTTTTLPPTTTTLSPTTTTLPPTTTKAPPPETSTTNQHTDVSPTPLTTPSTIPTTNVTLKTDSTTSLPYTILLPVTTSHTLDPEGASTPASTNAFTTEDHKVKIEPFPTASEPKANISRSSPRHHSPVMIVPDVDTQSTAEPDSQTVIIRESYELPSPPPSKETYVTTPYPTPFEVTESDVTVLTLPTTPVTSRITTPPTTAATLPPIVTVAMTTSSTTQATAQTTSIPETTIEEVTFQDPVLSSTERPSTIVGRTTETVTFPMPVNQPPTLKHHMKKLAITAGKAFRYIIPADLFTDVEDGSNLSFSLYEADNVPLSSTSWIQFNPTDREVYGLPLESHVSRWNFIVEAQDTDGAAAKGPLDITVQQHKGRRTINHDFQLTFKLNKNVKNTVDWQIRALEGIVNLFRDTDMDHLTVLNATQTGDECEFVWTNDTLPKDVCPLDDINRLMKILESESERGSPSAALARAMSPELKVGAVRWRGRGKCLEAAPLPPVPPGPPAPADTYPPVTRNQVDHLTATVGHLLVYKVPEDTFFDPEDGGTRSLSLALRLADRSALPAAHWLHFDTNNQEFYGLPAPSDLGAHHYQLVAEDSSKKSAYDSLIVEVVKSATIRPTVEFQMTLEYPYQSLAYSARTKRKVVEKLAALFGDPTTDAIRIHSITDNPTTIVWYNTSLPMDRCPNKEIEDLHKLIIDEEKGSTGGALKENVDRIFDKDFKVMSIRLIPLGLCADQNTKTPKVSIPTHVGTSQGNKPGTSDMYNTEYLVTYVIPAVVIVCMIIVAGIIACCLYRRRRTGKMSVGDEEERQAFRSKGIPVIFQDELEEGAQEPLHKSPVIMREEKPPLLPPAPDYRAGDSAPYRPPPPLAPPHAARAKPAPTYRKPPPYLPP